MNTILSRLASYPRKRYTEDGHDLDIAFITAEIWVMSLPSLRWPERLYRNSLPHVKALLDARAKDKYTIIELRAEGAGYPDTAFDGRVLHFPFIDHQPPPFHLLLDIMHALQNLFAEDDGKVAVIHCKAGKGRSGLVTCSFLVSQRAWAMEDALRHFTDLRMRPGFGQGLSIPSQRRWLQYIAAWTQAGRLAYKTGRVSIERLTVRNLRQASQLSILQFTKDGQEMVTAKRLDVQDAIVKDQDTIWEFKDCIVEDDICVYLVKGHAFAHFWINTYMETLMHKAQNEHKTTFNIAWEQVDGWKGTQWRGSRAYDAVTMDWTRIE